MAKEFRSNLAISTAPANPPLATHKLFDSSYMEFKGSPIDEFTARIRVVNKLSPQPTQFDAYQGQLVLLGTVAAVESFLRAIFRKAISMDLVCQEKALKKDVSYAAALHLTPELLPEALLEKISFTSSDNIEKALRELLGVSGELPADVKSVIDDYVKVCHLRHCAVHRFGKLGASNAVHLGILEHKVLLEKPLILDYVALQNAIAIATAFVRTLNSFLFNVLLSRLPDGYFSGVYGVDRGQFLAYYGMFADKTSSNRSAAPRFVYADFQRERTKYLASFHKPKK
jgi:hypothetical protein